MPKISENYKINTNNRSESTTQDTWTPSATPPEYATSTETKEYLNTEEYPSNNSQNTPPS